MPHVSRFSVTPVKGLALHHPEEVVLGPRGVAENRRFFLVDQDGELYSVPAHGRLVQVTAEYDPAREWLALRFPDGEAVEGEPSLGAETTTDFYGRPVPGRSVVGPWAPALSQYVGKELELVRADEEGGATDVHTVTLMSQESIAELARKAGREFVDGRRFRMLIEVAGCSAAHEEDTWAGRRVSMSDAVVRVLGPVPRCIATTRDPSTGVRDLDTLRVIKDYRGLRDKKKIDFGVYAEVVEPGSVRVGDAVEPL